MKGCISQFLLYSTRPHVFCLLLTLCLHISLPVFRSTNTFFHFWFTTHPSSSHLPSLIPTPNPLSYTLHYYHLTYFIVLLSRQCKYPSPRNSHPFFHLPTPSLLHRYSHHSSHRTLKPFISLHGRYKMECRRIVYW